MKLAASAGGGREHGSALDQDNIGGPLEVAPLTLGWLTEEAQQRLKLLSSNGSA